MRHYASRITHDASRLAHAPHLAIIGADDVAEAAIITKGVGLGGPGFFEGQGGASNAVGHHQARV